VICVIDNYDSFVYNLVQYIQEAGQKTVVYRNDRISISDIREMDPEAIILSPGPGTPDTAGICLECVRHFAGSIPILGVCLGHQSIAQAFGGRIIQAGLLFHGKTSAVYHDEHTVFSGLDSPLEAGRYHSLVVDQDSLPACLEISARLSDGTIMGLRHRQYAVEGLQFHPESVLTPRGKQILYAFLKNAGKRRTQ